MKNKSNCYCYKIINNKLYALNKQGKLFVVQKSLKSMVELYDFSCYNLAGITCYLDYIIVIGIDGSVYYYSIENSEIEYALELNSAVFTPPIVIDDYLIIQTCERLVSIRKFVVVASNEDIGQYASFKGISSYEGHIIAYKGSSLLFLFPLKMSVTSELSLLSTYIWSKAEENEFYIVYHTYEKFVVIDKKTSKIVFTIKCSSKRNFLCDPIITNTSIVYFDKNYMNIVYPDEKFRVRKYRFIKQAKTIFKTNSALFFVKRNRIIYFDLDKCRYVKKNCFSELLKCYKENERFF